MHEGNVILCGYQGNVSFRQGFVTDKILADTRQSRAAQSGHVIPSQGLHSDIASLSDQHGTEADRQIGCPRRVFADMGELRCEVCASRNLQ
jgi:hypothetical protein